MVLIEIGKNYSKNFEVKLMQAVQNALLDVFKITDEALNIRLLIHEKHRFMVPINLDPEQYVLVSIDCFSGRTKESKRLLYKTIVNNLNLLNIPRDHVKIVLREAPRENWGILGGFAGCDVDVGYKVEV